MIVRDIMTTKLITVGPDDTLSHAANLLRQYQFHHLPVVRTITLPSTESKEYTKARKTIPVLEGLLTSQDIDVVAAASQQGSSASVIRPWQERRVAEIMHQAAMRVTPITTVSSAAQILVERGLNYLPVVEYEQIENVTRPLLVGLVTRSDLLIALARSMGAFEPGMQLDILLPLGSMTPLVETLRVAVELHVQIRSIMAAPLHNDGVPRTATLRLGTINPTPLLVRLQEMGIKYALANPFTEGESNV